MTIVPRRISELPTLASSSIDGSEFLIIQQGPTTFKTQAAGFLGGGGGGSISGDGINFASVTVTSNAVTNGDNLRTAYAAAKLLTPNGIAISATNRVVVIVPPGKYDLVTTPLTMDAECVDLVGLTDRYEHVLITSAVATDNSGTVVQTANDVIISSVTLQNTQNTNSKNSTAVNPSAYMPSNSLPLTKLYNVNMIGTNLGQSMRNNVIYSGTYRDCVAGTSSFGYNGVCSGTFINCTAGSGAFGGTCSGTFTNCVSGGSSFGANGYSCTGVFTRCIAGSYSFGVGSAAVSGTFNNCTAGSNSFGQYSNASGTFNNCIAGDYSFGASSTCSGVFNNCIGGVDSFGGDAGTLAGATCRLFFCRLTAGTFNTRTSGAKIKRSFAIDTEVNDV